MNKLLIVLLFICVSAVSVLAGTIVFEPKEILTSSKLNTAFAEKADVVSLTANTGINASSFANLSTALSHPSTVGKQVIVSVPMTINSKTTDRHIVMSNSGQIIINAGGILNITNGYTGRMDAFIGAGQVIFQPGTMDYGLLTQGGPAQYVFGFVPNTSGGNSLGRMQVFTEIATGPAVANGFPMGNDLRLIAQGPADLFIEQRPLSINCTTSVVGGVPTLVTVSDTTKLSTASGVGLLVAFESAYQEAVPAANWSVVDATHLMITTVFDIPQPYKIAQGGTIQFNAMSAGWNAEKPADSPFVFTDRWGQWVQHIPNDLSGTWPISGLQYSAQLTGKRGANRDLEFRNSNPSGSIMFKDSANGYAALKITDTMVTTSFPFKASNLIYDILVNTFVSDIYIAASSGINTKSNTTTAATPYTIHNPVYGVTGQDVTIQIKNESGGALGTATWDSAYKLATWTNPPTGYNITITFWFDGTNWWEKSRSGNVPN